MRYKPIIVSARAVWVIGGGVSVGHGVRVGGEDDVGVAAAEGIVVAAVLGVAVVDARVAVLLLLALRGLLEQALVRTGFGLAVAAVLLERMLELEVLARGARDSLPLVFVFIVRAARRRRRRRQVGEDLVERVEALARGLRFALGWREGAALGACGWWFGRVDSRPVELWKAGCGCWMALRFEVLKFYGRDRALYAGAPMTVEVEDGDAHAEQHHRDEDD